MINNHISFQGTNYGSSYQAPYSSGIYDDFPSLASIQGAPPPHDMSAWNQMSLPPPPVPSTMFVNNVDDQMKKEGKWNNHFRCIFIISVIPQATPS